jgi:trimethylamine:corrinoid methyltransferase-like protein
MGLDTTLEEYRSVYWFPGLFERQFLAAWQGEGSMTIRERAHKMIRKLLSEHDYELEPELRRELDKILTRAKAEFSQ